MSTKTKRFLMRKNDKFTEKSEKRLDFPEWVWHNNDTDSTEEKGAVP